MLFLDGVYIDRRQGNHARFRCVKAPTCEELAKLSIKNISIAAKDIRLTATLLNYTQERVKQRLGCLGVTAKRVQVILSDINGPRGGEDKR